MDRKSSRLDQRRRTETELIPSSTLEPTTASWEADPVEEDPRLVCIGSFRYAGTGVIRRLTDRMPGPTHRSFSRPFSEKLNC